MAKKIMKPKAKKKKRATVKAPARKSPDRKKASRPVAKPKAGRKPAADVRKPAVMRQVKPHEEVIIMDDMSIKIENVVAFSVLGIDISLDKLVGRIENAEYEPEQFPGLVYRTKNPRAAALIFSSGKIVCTGAKSIEEAKRATGQVVDVLRKTGIKVPKEYSTVIENIVASSKINAVLALEELAFALENAEYEPEQFPGLVYRISEPRVTFLLFSSGKIICTGACSIDDVKRALARLKEKLKEAGVEFK
jgi:transcription initiation factor TFIID TATA-box-binding protein